MKRFRVVSLTLVFLLSVLFSSVNAEGVVIQDINEVPREITASFSDIMRKNAAYIAYAAYIEQTNSNTYPLNTGELFATKVKSGGEWDYKLTYGYSTPYKYDGMTITGEGLGNMHYGFTGRAAGFSSSLLKTAAGAVQIYSGTYHLLWYDSYFDDPNDQAWIETGITYWDNSNLPITNSISSLMISVNEEQNIPYVELLNEDEKTEIEKIIKSKIKENKENLKSGKK